MIEDRPEDIYDQCYSYTGREQPPLRDKNHH